jgi:hypothetical protein
VRKILVVLLAGATIMWFLWPAMTDALDKFLRIAMAVAGIYCVVVLVHMIIMG